MSNIPHKFTPTDYEKKWQDYWEEKKVYKTPEITNRPSENGNEARYGEKRQTATSEKPKDVAVVHETDIVAERRLPRSKCYILDMFPYPSAQGLHVGHPEGYTATDIYSRYLRMKGMAVLHPMGWDAFGLPAENFAIKQGIHPKITTDQSIENFRRQIKSLGFSYDWEKELATCKPDYYRWTQWLFELLYKQKLAYKKKAPVNWCESCKTVLANEQVVDGKCERCHNAVIQKEIAQWFFKITGFADDLLRGLDKIDWPISTKTGQTNWIGRSEGLLIKFPVLSAAEGIQNSEFKIQNSNSKFEILNSKFIEVFTTRPDTIFGVTFLILAPEHPQVLNLTDSVHMPQIVKYTEETKHKTHLERTDLTKKSGVFTGAYVLNPLTSEKIPVYVSDYVVMDYGAGAIMGVPAHDKRDWDFAKKMNLSIKPVCIPIETYNKLTRGNKVKKNSGNNLKIREIINANSGNKFPHDTKKTLVSDAYFIDQLESFGLKFPHENYGVCINCAEYSGLTSQQCITKISIDIISQGIGKKSVKYKLRDWLISRQRYWGAPIPIIYCENCGENLAPENELPVLLPEDVDFRPTGESPLVRSKSFHQVQCPKCGQPARRESDTMDTFVCSSWYFFAFTFWEHINKINSKLETRNSKQIQNSNDANSKSFENSNLENSKIVSDFGFRASNLNAKEMDPPSIFEVFKDEINEWLPVDLYVGGAEHTVLHLLYSRFITKALHRAGLIQFDEPFMKLRHIGMILGLDGQKMSKSRGNVINPDEIVNKFGADTMRLYEMFMGPLSDKKAWDTHGVEGCYRFLSRVWHLVSETDKNILDDVNEKIWQVTQELILKVENDIKEMKFNTAVAKMMTWLNEVQSQFSVFSSQLSEPSLSGIGLPVEEKSDKPKTDKPISENRKQRTENRDINSKFKIRDSLGIFLRVLAPFAPHLAEELWFKLSTFAKATADKSDILSDSTLKDYRSIHLESWPIVDKDTISTTSESIFLIEVNGKVVEKIAIDRLPENGNEARFGETRQTAKDIKTKDVADVHETGIVTESRVTSYALSLPRVQTRMAGKPPKKTIFIPNKLINFVLVK